MWFCINVFNARRTRSAISDRHRKNKFSLGSFIAELTISTFWIVLIYGLFTNLPNFRIDQNFVLRYMTSDSEKQAKNSTLFGGLLFIPVSILFFFIGTALFSYYHADPDALHDDLHSNSNSDKIFPILFLMVYRLE